MMTSAFKEVYVSLASPLSAPDRRVRSSEKNWHIRVCHLDFLENLTNHCLMDDGSMTRVASQVVNNIGCPVYEPHSDKALKAMLSHDI